VPEGGAVSTSWTRYARPSKRRKPARAHELNVIAARRKPPRRIVQCVLADLQPVATRRKRPERHAVLLVVVADERVGQRVVVEDEAKPAVAGLDPLHEVARVSQEQRIDGFVCEWRRRHNGRPRDLPDRVSRGCEHGDAAQRDPGTRTVRGGARRCAAMAPRLPCRTL
jgi:hypothetical protein